MNIYQYIIRNGKKAKVHLNYGQTAKTSKSYECKDDNGVELFLIWNCSANEFIKRNSHEVFALLQALEIGDAGIEIREGNFYIINLTEVDIAKLLSNRLFNCEYEG